MITTIVTKQAAIAGCMPQNLSNNINKNNMTTTLIIMSL